MKKSRDILSNAVETDRDVLNGERSVSGFRGDVSLVPQPPGVVADLDLYGQLKEVCAPNAIAEIQGELGAQLILDKGRCIMCGMCKQVAPRAIRCL